MVAGAAGDAPLVDCHQGLRAVVQPCHGLDLGDVDVLTGADSGDFSLTPTVSRWERGRIVAGQQGHDDGRGGCGAGEVAHLGGAEGQGFAVGAAQSLADAAARRQVDVVGLPVAVGAGQPEGRDGGHHQADVVAGKSLVVNADEVHLGGVQVLHQYVGARHHASQ